MDEKERSTNNRVFLILAIILLVLSGVLGWQLFEQKSENDRKTEVIKQINSEKDNLTAELDELLGQLAIRRDQQRSQLGLWLRGPRFHVLLGFRRHRSGLTQIM